MVERLFCSRRLKPGKGDEGTGVGGGGVRVKLFTPLLFFSLLYGNKYRGYCKSCPILDETACDMYLSMVHALGALAVKTRLWCIGVVASSIGDVVGVNARPIALKPPTASIRKI